MCTDNGKSCYPGLQGVGDKTYYAAVENPVEALRTIGGEHYYSSVDKNGQISDNVEVDIGKITFLDFSDAHNQDRVSSLRKHGKEKKNM